MASKKEVMYLLINLFNTKYDELNYDNVDEFYAFIGYDLESEQLLQELNICGTSDLLDALEDVA